MGNGIAVTYEGDDGEASGTYDLNSSLVTEFLGSPFFDVPNKVSNGIVLAQTGYRTGKGVCIAVYETATDTITEQYLYA